MKNKKTLSDLDYLPKLSSEDQAVVKKSWRRAYSLSMTGVAIVMGTMFAGANADYSSIVGREALLMSMLPEFALILLGLFVSYFGLFSLRKKLRVIAETNNLPFKSLFKESKTYHYLL